MSPEIENEVLDRVAMSRRSFVRRIMLGTAFAVPAVASFDMRSLTAFAADCIAPNQTAVVSDERFTVQLLDTDAVTEGIKLKVKVRDAQTDENVGSPPRAVRLRKIDPEPAGGPDLPTEFAFKKDGRYYQLKLDTSSWANDDYTLRYTVGKDRTRFSVVMLVGGC